MFTGIIETVGIIHSVREKSGAREFVITAPEISGDLKPGDSITVAPAQTLTDKETPQLLQRLLRELRAVVREGENLPEDRGDG